MFIEEEKQALSTSLDSKFVRKSFFDDHTPKSIFNGRSFKKAYNYSPYPRNRTNNVNNYYFNRPWQYKFRNSTPAGRRFICRDSCCHFHHCNMCRRNHFFDNMQNHWGADSNFTYKSRKGNFNVSIRRANSCETISSPTSFGSNIIRNSHNSQSNYNLNRNPINNFSRNQNRNETRRGNKDPRRCPLDEHLQYEISKIRERFALTANTSPLHRLNVNAEKCVPKLSDTGVKLTVKFGNFYKPLEKKDYSF